MRVDDGERAVAGPWAARLRLLPAQPSARVAGVPSPGHRYDSTATSRCSGIGPKLSPLVGGDGRYAMLSSREQLLIETSRGALASADERRHRPRDPDKARGKYTQPVPAGCEAPGWPVRRPRRRAFRAPRRRTPFPGTSAARPRSPPRRCAPAAGAAARAIRECSGVVLPGQRGLGAALRPHREPRCAIEDEL